MVLSDIVPYALSGLILTGGWTYEVFSSHTEQATIEFRTLHADVAVLQVQEERDISDLKEIRKSLQRIEEKIK